MGAVLRKGEAGLRTMAKSVQTVCAGIVTRLGDVGKLNLRLASRR